jgi:N6-L-threonylcarbamoyladenine synthase
VALVVSGGHTLLVRVEEPFRHRVLGETLDDAAGEAFDKVAKMLGLPYPGGPEIDRRARRGNPAAIRFPRSFPRNGGLDFSFSGIKTSVLYFLRDHPHGEEEIADICAGFQAAVVEVLVTRTMAAARQAGVRAIALAGGVSANSALRHELRRSAEAEGATLFAPRLEYCMDNGAMIAHVGWMRLVRGLTSPYDVPAVARLGIAQETK